MCSSSWRSPNRMRPTLRPAESVSRLPSWEKYVCCHAAGGAYRAAVATLGSLFLKVPQSQPFESCGYGARVCGLQPRVSCGCPDVSRTSQPGSELRLTAHKPSLTGLQEWSVRPPHRRAQRSLTMFAEVPRLDDISTIERHFATAA